jgi:putative SOS response-associated peptidase YedK
VQTLADSHDRDPVILPECLWEHWIDPTITGNQALVDEAVRAGIPEAESLHFDQVAPFKTTDDGPQLLQPVSVDRR